MRPWENHKPSDAHSGRAGMNSAPRQLDYFLRRLTIAKGKRPATPQEKNKRSVDEYVSPLQLQLDRNRAYLPGGMDRASTSGSPWEKEVIELDLGRSANGVAVIQDYYDPETRDEKALEYTIPPAIILAKILEKTVHKEPNAQEILDKTKDIMVEKYRKMILDNARKLKQSVVCLKKTPRHLAFAYHTIGRECLLFAEGNKEELLEEYACVSPEEDVQRYELDKMNHTERTLTATIRRKIKEIPNDTLRHMALLCSHIGLALRELKFTEEHNCDKFFLLNESTRIKHKEQITLYKQSYHRELIHLRASASAAMGQYLDALKDLHRLIQEFDSEYYVHWFWKDDGFRIFETCGDVLNKLGLNEDANLLWEYAKLIRVDEDVTARDFRRVASSRSLNEKLSQSQTTGKSNSPEGPQWEGQFAQGMKTFRQNYKKMKNLNTIEIGERVAPEKLKELKENIEEVKPTIAKPLVSRLEEIIRNLEKHDYEVQPKKIKEEHNEQIKNLEKKLEEREKQVKEREKKLEEREKQVKGKEERVNLSHEDLESTYPSLLNALNAIKKSLFNKEMRQNIDNILNKSHIEEVRNMYKNTMSNFESSEMSKTEIADQHIPELADQHVIREVRNMYKNTMSNFKSSGMSKTEIAQEFIYQSEELMKGYDVQENLFRKVMDEIHRMTKDMGILLEGATPSGLS